jgi:hypothetical protein
MIAPGQEVPSVKRFDGHGAFGEVPLSSKLDGLWLVPGPMLLGPRMGLVDGQDGHEDRAEKLAAAVVAGDIDVRVLVETARIVGVRDDEVAREVRGHVGVVLPEGRRPDLDEASRRIAVGIEPLGHDVGVAVGQALRPGHLEATLTVDGDLGMVLVEVAEADEDLRAELAAEGCDRASAKDFGGNRTIFCLKGPSVPTTTEPEA